MRRFAVFATVFVLSLQPSPALENEQQRKAADHQSVAATVQPEPAKLPIITATPSLPTANPNAGEVAEQSWRYSDAIAPPTWGNWALAIFAALAFRIGLRTLGEMNHQSKNAETAANAAKESADSLINTERAWLMLVRLDDPVLVPGPQAGQPKGSGTVFRYRNYGRTPAWIVESAGRLVKYKLGEAPKWPIDYGKILRAKANNGDPVPPEQPTNPTWQPLEPNALLPQAEFEEIQRGESVLFLYAFINYRDVFGQTRITRFCVEWRAPSGARTIGDWVYSGPEEANLHT